MSTHDMLPQALEPLSFPLHGSRLIEGMGRVVRVNPPGVAGRAAGMGIEFQFADAAERRESERTVEKLLVDQLGEHIAEKLLGKKMED